MHPPGLTRAPSYFIDTATPKQNGGGKEKKKNRIQFMTKSKAQQVLQVCVHFMCTTRSLSSLIQEIALDIFSALSMQHLAKSNHAVTVEQQSGRLAWCRLGLPAHDSIPHVRSNIS